MVLRDLENEPFHLQIDGTWCLVDDDVLKAHPGGSAITTYRNMDATTVFHTFHSGSKEAYSWLTELKKKCPTQSPEIPPIPIRKSNATDVNLGSFNVSDEKSKEIDKDFNKMRMKLRLDGLFDSSPLFYTRKVLEPIITILFAFYLQSQEFYFFSAVLMGVAWQQLGWLIHEFTHHQCFKNRWYNDLTSYFVGNFLQGFSSSGWKEQHNVHHAATNVVGRDGDLDLVPFYATVAEHLEKVPEDSVIMMFYRWQHLHWPFMMPFLRLSWLLQSVLFVKNMQNHYYNYYRSTAKYEQIALILHWTWSLTQLYFIPYWTTRIMFFFVSHMVGGFLLAHVVTYNHYSVEKFALSSNIMSNYACLQMMTTRNMQPGRFIDWLWGGLNYQIEHHLFPTMPRHNLSTVMPIVKEFAKKHDLPYMVDDYSTGFWLGVEQFRNVAVVASQPSIKED